MRLALGLNGYGPLDEVLSTTSGEIEIIGFGECGRGPHDTVDVTNTVSVL